MGEELRVKDIMSDPNGVVVVSPYSSLRDVVQAFTKIQEFSLDKDGVVIVKDAGRIVGMLGPFDVLWAIQPGYLRNGTNGTGFDIVCEVFWEGLFTENCHRVAEQVVSEYMRPPVLLSPEDNLMKASYMLDKSKVNTALVMEQDELVGVVRFGKLFSVMAGTVA